MVVENHPYDPNAYGLKSLNRRGVNFSSRHANAQRDLRVHLRAVGTMKSSESGGDGPLFVTALQTELWPQKNAEIAKKPGSNGLFLGSLRSFTANIRSGKSVTVFLKMLYTAGKSLGK